jgi:DNA-binding PadR family transcriptional regulator
MFEKSEKANPRFTQLHLLITLKILEENAPIGRKRLIHILTLGEGSVRTILKKLKKEGLITSSKLGHRITGKGKNFLKTNFHVGGKVRVKGLTLGKEDYAILVKNAANKIKSGIEQRDEAIKVGAAGASTLIYDGKRLKLPGDLVDIKKEYPGVIEEISSKFPLEKGDIIIVGSGDTLTKAMEGALAAAKTLR